MTDMTKRNQGTGDPFQFKTKWDADWVRHTENP
jgi:hypothetical protein